MDILRPICKYCIVGQKNLVKNLEMQCEYCKAGNFANYNLMIMDVGIT
jgi:hypothetical protein